MDFSTLRSVFANGPVDCSALAAAESYSTGTDGPILAGDGTIDFASTAQFIADNYPKSVACYAIGACVFLAECPSAAAASDSANPKWTASALPGAPAAADRAKVKDVTKEHVLGGIAIIFAGKVNYWKTNHHTGEGKFTGYMAKVCGKLKIDTSNSECASLIWRLCHWADTRVILAACGVSIPGSLVTDDKKKAVVDMVNIPEDALKRIRSNPAGSAAWMDVYTAIRHAEAYEAAHITGCKLAVKSADAANLAARICNGDPSFHMGSGYLCKTARVVLPEWPPAVINWAKTAIYHYDPNSTLLKAAILERASVVDDHITIYRQYATMARESVQVTAATHQWAE